jgi:hypothetical protein
LSGRAKPSKPLEDAMTRLISAGLALTLISLCGACASAPKTAENTPMTEEERQAKEEQEVIDRAGAVGQAAGIGMVF